jgi:uncharacterized protein YbaP (TraB family)
MPIARTPTITGPMRRQVLTGLVAATGGLGGWAAQAEPAPEWPLWSVEGGGGRVYLLGDTYPRPTDWRNARIEALLPGCAVLWTETNQIVRGDMNALVARYGVDPAAPLSTRLTAEDQARLAKAAALCRTPLESLSAFRPWLAGASLEGDFYKAMGLSGQAAARLLAAKAKDAGVPVSSEFAAQDDIFAWFGAMTPAQDVQYLRYVLDEILAGSEGTAGAFADWAKGDFRRAEAVNARIRRLYPDFDRLIIERNRRWVPRFQTMLGEEKPGMVVVGHLHLVGPDNVLDQLRTSGLTVRRL